MPFRSYILDEQSHALRSLQYRTGAGAGNDLAPQSSSSNNQPVAAELPALGGLMSIRPVHTSLKSVEALAFRISPGNDLSISLKAREERFHNSGSVADLHVRLPGDLLQEVAGKLFGVYGEGVEMASTAIADDKCLAILLECEKQLRHEVRGGDAVKLDYLTRAIAAHVLTKYAVLPVAAEGRTVYGGLSRHQLKSVLDYICEHLATDLSIVTLADIVCLGRGAFIRRFKASLGMSPHQYVMKARVGKAQELLRGHDLNLVQIALACGFTDQAHFCSVFKRSVGQSPSAYRNGGPRHLHH